MLYRKQTGFDAFRCIADQCPKSCCEGWQIVIDEDSLEKYAQHSGPFADRLHAGINSEEQCFRQSRMRCSMLAASGLCDLQSTLGESYLCDTCRRYPRHTEEFLDLREYSLSLSCPEAVRMLLDPAFTFGIQDSEDDAADDPEDFDDFDFLLFDKLDLARDRMLQIAVDHSLPFQERLRIIASAALELQELYDQGELFAMEDVQYDGSWSTTDTGAELSYDYLLQSLTMLLDLEVLESSWTSSLLTVQKYWKTHSADSAEWKEAMHPAGEREALFEKLFQSLLFTYFCGSVYDGQIYARTMLAVASVRWLMMLSYAQPEQTLHETVYLFSREVEHSDLNINALISYFEREL